MAAPAVDLVLDTTAAVVCGSLTVLTWVRFRERREAIAFYQASAFLSLAVAYSVAVAVSLGRDAHPETLADPSTPQTWVFALARASAAVLLIVGGTTMLGRGALRHPTFLVLLPPLAVLLLAVGGYSIASVPDPLLLIVADVPPDSLPRVTSLGVLVQVLIATLFLEAAFVCRAAWRRDRVVMDAWVAVGLVFAAFAEIMWILYPSGHPGQVAVADVVRLAFVVALLLGLEAEARITLIRLRTANVELSRLRDLEGARAAMDERGRLARELHDGLAQDLWLAKLKAGQIGAIDGLPDAARPLLQDAEAAIDSGLNEARQAVLALRLAASDDEGFCSLIRRYVDDFEDRFAIRVEFVCEADATVVAARTQVEVLRIAQEALTNARQHSGASVVGMRLVAAHGRVVLRIVDNGSGFDTRRKGGDRFGLLSMRERAALIGGRFRVRSRVGDGTAVFLVAPSGGPRRDPAGVAAT
jgi:signal transduction histidine kinase